MSGLLTHDDHPLVNLSSSTLGMPPSPQDDHQHAAGGGGSPTDSRAQEADIVSPRTASAFLSLHARAKERKQEQEPNKSKHRPTHITLPENAVSREKQSPSYPPSQNESQIRLTGPEDEPTTARDDLPDDVYIPTSEAYGLPRRDKNAFRKQAQAIIAARKMTAASNNGSAHKSSLSVNTVDSAATSDDEDSTDPPLQMPRGAGILGSLNAFESQQQQQNAQQRKQEERRKVAHKEKKSRTMREYLHSGIDKARSRWEGDSPSAFAALAGAGVELGGAASAEGTVVRPDPERKGYHVNRWSLQSTPEDSAASSPKNPRRTHPTTPELEHVTEKLQEHSEKNDGGDYFNMPSANSSTHKKAPSDTSWDLSSSLGRMNNMFTPSGLRSGRTSPKPEKKKRNKQELWITRHIAGVLERQDFILQLARACMLFGAPTHALEEHIEDTARVLDVSCQSVLILSFMVISFKDDMSGTSTIRIIKQSTALDLGKLRALSYIHNAVIKDEMSVSEASDEISELMLRKPFYGMLTGCALGAACSVCISPPAFNASFLDLLIIAPLGAFVILAQGLTARYFKRFNSVLEVLLVGTVSFTACALSATRHFCFASVLSGSIVLLLPGWLVCQSALELQNRSITSGSIRLVWTLIYALFLGFGISLGATIWIYSVPDRLLPVDPTDTTCSASHGDDWWNVTLSPYFAFLFVPLYPIFLAMKNQAKFFTKEFAGSTIISICGWVVNHFAAKRFSSRADLTSVLGAATVGLISSCWSKAFEGPSFIVAVCAIMFQLPSGLSNGGLLSFATTEATDSATAAFSNLFSVAEQLLIVALGLVVGLFTSTALFSLGWSMFWKKRHMKAKDLVSF